jgi:hypothetical protein
MAARTPNALAAPSQAGARLAWLFRARRVFARLWITAWALYSCSLGTMAELDQYRVDQLTTQAQWAVIDWEARHLPPSTALAISQIFRPMAMDRAEALVRSYVQGQLAGTDDPELMPALVAVVDRELAESGITTVGGSVFPPVLFVFDAPPQSLIVSPRTEIQVSSYALVTGELPLPLAQELEQSVERLDVSALVVQIGGIATYPTLIPPDTPPGFALQTIAHEWTHTALFVRPLGRAYAQSRETRAINESTADVVGAEISRRVLERLQVPPRVGQESPRTVDFRQRLRRIRLAVDELLAAGDVAGAEVYMERERQELETDGIYIRRLNQAYFAFYGNYAEGPAGSTEIPDRLRDLRARSASLGQFLDRVGDVTSLNDLRRLGANP